MSPVCVAKDLGGWPAECRALQDSVDSLNLIG